MAGVSIGGISSKSRKKLEVSDLFVKIYRGFNVDTQVEDMKKLSRKELLLLLSMSVESFSHEDDIVSSNWLEFSSELRILCDSLPDVGESIEIKDEDLLQLSEDTGSDTIDVDVVVDKHGNKLYPLTTSEVIVEKRNLLINKIVK